MTEIIRSSQPLGEATKNVGTLFLNNLEKYGAMPAFAERVRGEYRTWSWSQLVGDILKVSLFLQKTGLKQGDRLAFISANSYDRLITEMAAMAAGYVAVPIFGGYSCELTSELLVFSEVKMLVTDVPLKMAKLPPGVLPSLVLLISQGEGFKAPAFKGRVSVLEQVLSLHAELGSKSALTMMDCWRAVGADDVAMVMYTSGTSNAPKGVMLTHANLMTQQRALDLLWKLKPGMRFLCYLPWHHSFGGLFERFCALHSGGCLAIDDSFGKSIDQLFKNFAEIKPNVYFSVPKIYQEIVSRVLTSKECENIFFSPDLEFVFTAAAPLPLSISAIFKTKGVPVVEGWGLTETSPCCTLTPRSVERQSGVVGFPIPAVEVKLGDDNEIMVKGPNVMKGYFKQPGATSAVLDAQGWFKTGDVGEFTQNGLKIVSRKDRMFKLSNGEKVFPAVIEDHIKSHCKFIKHAYVFGKGQTNPFLLVFPNSELIAAEAVHPLDESACEHPCDLSHFSECLGVCLQKVNHAAGAKFEIIKKAVIVAQEPSIENNELTPSFKLISKTIEEKYQKYIRALEENKPGELPDDGYIVDVEKITVKG